MNHSIRKGSKMKKTISIALVLALGMVTEVVNADFTFGTPTVLEPPVNTSSSDALGCFSADGLEMYFDSNRSGGYGRYDLWVAKRPTIDDDWGTPENLGPTVNSSDYDVIASLSTDGLELYFSRGEVGDIWVTTRATTDDDWGNAVNLGPVVNTSGRDMGPSISTDGLELYFAARSRAGGYGSDDIWVTRRATKNDPWESPINLGPVVNTSASEATPFLSADGLALFFNEDRNQPGRPGGHGKLDMWVTTRATTDDPWGTPVNLGPILNTAGLDGGPRVSPDGSTLYFTSDRPGGYGPGGSGGGAWADIWQAPIIPIVDFNGDGIVDSADMCIMVDHWHTDDPFYDIGPMPWGDGIVDVQDLIVLSEHLFEEILPPELIAYWKLDETDGNIAENSVSANHGTLHGEPLWQPAGGKKGGTLQFDGIDDYVSTLHVLDAGAGAFSTFAWIRAGTPGQVIISQVDQTVGRGIRPGSAWLGSDPSGGRLMTGLMGTLFGPLESDSAITDGQWHHVGLVYDFYAFHRHLYVDGAEVAADANPVGGVYSGGGLYIGAGKDLEAASFFSGLIDDIRIYDVALSADEIAAMAR
jgi:hypothetical protein